MNRQDRITMALKDALPIVIAYFPISVTFGVLAAASGLSSLYTMLGSVWIYSGGAQFMLIGMVGYAAVPAAVITTILLVNLRHILYGATIGPYMKTWNEPLKWAAAFGLTDEVYAVVSSRLKSGERLMPAYYLTFAFAAYASWIAGTIVGIGLGGLVPSELSDILEFALPAMFIALLFGGEINLPTLASATTGAALAITAGMIGLGGAGIVLGGLGGATMGLVIKNYQNRRQRSSS